MKVTNVYDIKEYVKVDDDHSNIRGYVVMKDSEGRVLFEKNNMIVSSGRKIIKDLVYKNVFKGSAAGSATFSEIRFGSGREITSSNMKGLESYIDSINTGDSADIKVITSHKSEDDKCIKLTSELTAKSEMESVVVSEAGIFLSDDTMFSRVVFAPLTLKASQTYTLNYYIYF